MRFLSCLFPSSCDTHDVNPPFIASAASLSFRLVFELLTAVGNLWLSENYFVEKERGLVGGRDSLCSLITSAFAINGKELCFIFICISFVWQSNPVVAVTCSSSRDNSRKLLRLKLVQNIKKRPLNLHNLARWSQASYHDFWKHLKNWKPMFQCMFETSSEDSQEMLRRLK